MASESRNLAQQRREKDGIVYFERGILTGRDGRRYQRYAIQTHFVEVGESAAELVKNSRSLVRVDVLPYQRAAGAKYEMVGREYAPGFDESVPPRFHTEIFDRMGIPYRVF